MDTKESIMITALQLFANRGYDAVSVSDISGALGLSKGALYRHYASKRDILNSIVKRMEQEDINRAKKFGVPVGSYAQTPQMYRDITVEKLMIYAKEEFTYWTKDEFASSFRKMLTIEQYKDKELQKLYQKHILDGVLTYLEGIFKVIGITKKGQIENPKHIALEFYATFYMLLSLYDTVENKDEVEELFELHIKDFYQRFN